MEKPAFLFSIKKYRIRVFYNEELSSKIADIVKSTGKSCEADATTIAISVNDRSESNITKRFEKLDIDWPIVERQLQA